ncbi:MAG: beta-ketoacyl-[acyl-carrier-protein] synthase family protein [Deltaproteobacteria bacterium]|nr:beta-ketoacyl-[acyl-carrier-protein] synthase family protein [Deltaproteobacteria bacterium]
MQPRRVVVTGMGAVSPFGKGVDILMESLIQGKSAVKAVTGLEKFGGLRTRVAALVPALDPKEIPRKFRRTMSKMSVFATLACQEALDQAGLSKERLSDGKMGVAIGSSVGSPIATQGFYEDFLIDHSLERMRSTLFFQIMNHSCAANVSHALGITGRILAPSAACSTSCQTVGYGFDIIASGKQDLMLCGGAEEFHPLMAATFDTLNAASIGYNDRPSQTPRPFDRDRDGVVCGEGSGILLLESLDSAESRGAAVFAEILGFATLSDASNIANPNADSMEACIQAALADARMEPGEVNYVNAHATATEQGDIAESAAIGRVFGGATPVSSIKGHLGHTMAASGALELVATVEMIGRDCLIPTLNLDNIDPSCKKIRHIQDGEHMRIHRAIKNNFAFGGVNSSIVLRRHAHD